MKAVARYARLTVFFGGVGLRRLTEYRLDFLLGMGSFLIRLAAQTAVLAIVFRQVPRIGGWGYNETLFLFGFSLLPRGLDHLFTDQLWELGRKLVQTGEFFRYVIRPVGPLFALLSERFLYPDGFGEVLVGLALTGYAAAKLRLALGVVGWLAAVALVLCGAVIFTATKLLWGSAAFWTTTSLPAMSAVYRVSDFAAYPLDIYRPSLRRILTWVLPFAFTAYIPVKYVLFGDAGLVWWTPVVAAATMAVAVAVWRRGVDRYEMTGT
jgi:ABC-2 type transport system permease protein